MKLLNLTALVLITLNFATAATKEKLLRIVDTASAESIEGPIETFTGKVRITMILQPEDSASTSCASVNFAPGARSAWHSHPKGQLLVVTDGAGLIQQKGKQIQRIKK